MSRFFSGKPVFQTVNKYHNNKSSGYDSEKEHKRAVELSLMQRAGIISNLQEQVKYELIPPQYDTVNGKKKCIERACCYYADFQYVDEKGNTVVEDTKGMRTAEYIIKRKLMLHVHGIKIKEI
jgi:hypothetical protein